MNIDSTNSAGGFVGTARAPAASTSELSLVKHLVLVVELACLVLLIHLFGLEESRGLLTLSVLILVGFVIHSLLAERHRLPFFLLLSIVGVASVLGLTSATWILGLGLALVGLCHLPLPFYIRIGLTAAAGGFLAWLRVGTWNVPWDATIWPILGSMFMFRLIVYLYDIRHEKRAAPIAQRLSYFFLLPNVCFPLFPIVDYTTFRRTYYNDEPYRIYQTGIHWMLRGITHLILYRLVYLHLTLSPEEVADVWNLAGFVFTNYLLYLRVSGQFHLIVGILCLFGFNLPETHHFYYLASSFNDFWRKINIYWKDFMMKIFFYPAFMKLRKLGGTQALVLATIFVFFCTWILHSYQWFWLRGSFIVRAQDGVFWSLLGILVVVNTLREQKSGKRARLQPTAVNFRQASLLAVRTTGFFVVISVFWSFWTSSSVPEWLSLWSLSSTQGIPRVMVVLALVVVIGIAWQLIASALKRRNHVSFTRSFAGSLVVAGLSIALLMTLGLAPHLSGSQGGLTELVASLQETRLSARDQERLVRGYYEELLHDRPFDTPLSETQALEPHSWVSIVDSGAARYNDNDFPFVELIPSSEIAFKNATLRTNRWGMRDRDYVKSKPPSTYRIALVGGSEIMGSGVENPEVFEAIIEDRLNAKYVAGDQRVEILNFAVAEHFPLQRLLTLETRVLDFDPDAVFYFAHEVDESFLFDDLAAHVSDGVEPPFRSLMEIVAAAEVDGRTPTALARKRLHPFAEELHRRTLQRFFEHCQKRQIVPVWIYWPLTKNVDETHLRWETNVSYATKVSDLKTMAKDLGFHVVDLSTAYDGYKPEELALAAWDNHPNATAHTLMAKALYSELQTPRTQAALGWFDDSREEKAQ